MKRVLAILAAGALWCAPALSFAQTPAGSEAAAMPFRMLDQERLFRDSAFGQAVLERIRAAEAVLEAENQRLFDLLAAEERVLTEERSSLSPEAFRVRADAFDARVEAIRAERAEASRALAQQSEAEAQAFFDAALPVLVQMMGDLGIVALLKPDVVILGADWLDITPEAIARLDALQAPTSGN